MIQLIYDEKITIMPNMHYASGLTYNPFQGHTNNSGL